MSPRPRRNLVPCARRAYGMAERRARRGLAIQSAYKYARRAAIDEYASYADRLTLTFNHRFFSQEPSTGAGREAATSLSGT